MSKFKLSARSLQRLEGLHPDLVKIVKRAIEITPFDFMVVEGIRSAERQKQLVAKGASKTMNSRHLTGHAVDLAPIENGAIPWNNKNKFNELAAVMKRAAIELRLNVEWGGDWRRFYDGPHFQLPKSEYP